MTFPLFYDRIFLMKQELLAPAGDLDTGYAALYYGADALYTGLKQFSARATAVNLSDRELNELTAYAHHLHKKVYVTVNTLIQETELPELLNTLDTCATSQVDGIILQDLGVARVIKNHFSTLALHASTQMAVHNKEGALALQKLGFQRVVLARELSLKEIQEIAAIPNLETEAFIHGALCYSYSGLCLFSSMETGRSANRGKCTYPCRALFQGPDGEKHYFSMKDLALEENILKMPVTSLKIEGRKKSPLYVAAVTNYYRHILDTGKADPEQAEHIQQIFARPWTTNTFFGKNKDVIDRDFVGHRGLVIGQVENVTKGVLSFKTTRPVMRFDGLQIDVDGYEKPFGFSVQDLYVRGKSTFQSKAGDTLSITLPPNAPFLKKGQPIYLASSMAVKGAYKYTHPKPNAYRIRPNVSITIQITPKKIVASAKGVETYLTGNFAVANKDLTPQIITVFEKDKDCDFKANPITVHNPQHLFVPVSILNQLRRDLYSKIVLTQTIPLLEENHRSIPTPSWCLKTDQLACLQGVNLESFSEIIVVLTPDFDLNSLQLFPKKKIRLALPTVERNPQKFVPLIRTALHHGFKKWEIGNVWGLSVLPKNGIDLSFDSPLYMMNTQSLYFAKEIGAHRETLAMEDTLENMCAIAKTSPIPLTTVVYQDIPLFSGAHCLRKTCAGCPGKPFSQILKKGTATYHVFTKNCQVTVYNEQVFYLKDYFKIPSDFYRIDFINRPYTPQQVSDIISKVQKHLALPQTHTGNMLRSL